MTTRDAGAAFTAIYEIGKIFDAAVDISHEIPDVLNVLRKCLGIQRSAFMLGNGSGRLELHSSVGLSRTHLARACYTSSEGVVGKVYSSGMSIIIPDAENEKAFHESGRDCQPMESDQPAAFVAVPIRAGSKILGVLACDHTTDQTRQRGGDNLQLLSTVAAFIGQKIEHAGEATGESGVKRDQGRDEDARTHRNFGDGLVGISVPMQKILAEAHLAAPTRSSILLRGELGTGKGMMAEEIHQHSSRREGAFIRVNCAMYTEAQLDEELFGLEKKTSDGAKERRLGALEMANGGTLFLDGVCDIAPGIQTRLFHVLRERAFRRLGGDLAISVDFRLISATSLDLERMVASGEFRADLYYQINVVSLYLPPLRERREDIPDLADRLVERYNVENERSLKIAPQAMNTLCKCNWSGNIRELGNCLEHAATMARGNSINTLPCASRDCLAQTLSRRDEGGFGSSPYGNPVSFSNASIIAMEGMPPANQDSILPADEDGRIVRREQLIGALKQCGWVQAKAARLLNLTPRRVSYAMQKYQIDVRKF